MESVVRADGTIVTWENEFPAIAYYADWHEKQQADELAHPDELIPCAVCICPPLPYQKG